MSEHATTFCRDCRHLWIASKGDGWWKWMCMKAPLPMWTNPVTGNTAADPPYHSCKRLNSGDCTEFEAGHNQLNPKVGETDATSP
jgi:hypothetical protein